MVACYVIVAWNISISGIYRGKKPVINLHNNFDLLWLFFSAHFHFIDLYKMNLDFFLCLNSQIIIFVQPVLLFAVYISVYIDIDKYLPFSVHMFNKVFRGKKKSFLICAPPPWFSPLYSVNLPSLQNTGGGSRYT